MKLIKVEDRDLAPRNAIVRISPKLFMGDSYYRIRRAVMGAIVIAIAGAILIKVLVFPSGYETSLSSSVAVVRAPAAGTLQIDDVHMGDRVKSGMRLGTLNAAVGLQSMLLSATEDTTKLQSELASINDRIAYLEQQSRLIDSDAGKYRTARQNQFAAQVSGSQAVVDSARAKVTLADAQLARIAALNGKGYATNDALERAQQAAGVARAELGEAQAKLVGSNVEAAAARKGVLIANGYSDVQYSTQRRDQLAMQLDTLRGEKQRVESLLKTTDSLTSPDGAKPVTPRSLALPLTAPIGGTIWSQDAMPGETVTAGGDLFHIADCSKFLAFFTVTRSQYAAVALGTPVRFRPLGTSGDWRGRIVSLGARDPNSLHVTNPPKIRDTDYLIGARIDLPPAVAATCPIGLAGRVTL